MSLGNSIGGLLGGLLVIGVIGKGLKNITESLDLKEKKSKNKSFLDDTEPFN